MKGLEIKIITDGIISKNEEKYAKLFVLFKDKKYGTNYVIYTDNTNKVLYYGSPLVNNKKMVIMKFKNPKEEEMVKDFIWNYLNNNSSELNKFEIYEIPSLDKLEIIDSNVLDVKEEYITKLLNIFFPKKEEIPKKEETPVKRKTSKLPLIILIVVALLAIGGYIYLKKHPELIYGKNIYMECKKQYTNEEYNASVNEYVFLTFYNNSKIKKREKTINYNFNDNDSYYDFKEKEIYKKYIEEEGTPKYNDEELNFQYYIDYNLAVHNQYTTLNALTDLYQTNNFTCNLIEKWST